MEWLARRPPWHQKRFSNFIILNYSLIRNAKSRPTHLGPTLAACFPRFIIYPSATMPTALMIPLLTAAGAASFWLFYRAIGFFDRI